MLPRPLLFLISPLMFYVCSLFLCLRKSGGSKSGFPFIEMVKGIDIEEKAKISSAKFARGDGVSPKNPVELASASRGESVQGL